MERLARVQEMERKYNPERPARANLSMDRDTEMAAAVALR